MWIICQYAENQSLKCLYYPFRCSFQGKYVKPRRIQFAETAPWCCPHPAGAKRIRAGSDHRSLDVGILITICLRIWIMVV